jgi:hypothetical protein
MNIPNSLHNHFAETFLQNKLSIKKPTIIINYETTTKKNRGRNDNERVARVS